MKAIEMYTFKSLTMNSFLTTLLLLIFQSSLQAQCADVYLYRVNNKMVQSERTIYVFHDGQQIAASNLGDRYKASVCTPGQYEFVVKTDPNGVSIIKKTIQVESGKNYHLKLACLKVGDIATIDLVSAEKGAREVQKGSKFKGAIKSFNLSQPSIAGNQQSQGGGGGVTKTPISNPTDGAFQRVQTSNGFKFEVVNVSKAGDMMLMDYKITNMTGNDRILTSTGYCSAFYDDIGNFLNIREVCIMTSCRKQFILNSESTSFINGTMNANAASSVVPYGIPVTGRITFRGLNNKATKFVRGGLIFRSASKTNNKEFVDFRINYTNIIFPSEIDPNNPQNRIVGDIGIELKNAQRETENVKLSFNLKNATHDDKLLEIKGAQAYDNFGNEIKLLGVSFGTQVINKNRYQYKHTIPASANTYFNLWLSPFSRSANKIARVKVQFDGYELEWNDITVQGGTSSATNNNVSSTSTSSNDKLVSKGNNYLNYTDFTTSVRNKEVIRGKKVILEKINFNSASADILDSSTNQLDEIAQLILSNSYLKMEFSGHTDNVGDETNNMLLSQQRADAIRYYLIKKGVDPSRIISVGRGEKEPIASNLTSTGKQQNRRVEIKILE